MIAKGAVRVLFFAALRESLDARELWVGIEDGTRAKDLLRCLQSVYPQGSDLLSQARVAVNQEMAEADRFLADGDEVALLLPVSGG